MFRFSSVSRFSRLSVCSRNLSSSVLLNPAWESQSHNICGLSLNQDHDRSKAFRAISTRLLSTANDTSVAPGNPQSPQMARDPPQGFLNMSIPDIPDPDPEPVQVPYVPDFWDSSVPEASPPLEEPLPKLLVVAGADTHHGGGPSHNLLDEHSHEPDVYEDISITSIPRPRGPSSLWDDIAEDIGIPYPKDIKNAIRKVFI